MPNLRRSPPLNQSETDLGIVNESHTIAEIWYNTVLRCQLSSICTSKNKCSIATDPIARDYTSCFIGLENCPFVKDC